jgi:mono/diheme cytochrome c family protein
MILAACLLMTSAGCRQNMHNQNKLEPYEASAFFADGQGSRQLPAGTVPRNAFGEDIAPYTGLSKTPSPSATPVPAPAPIPAMMPAQARTAQAPQTPQVTMAMLRRGQERFNIFCSPCHGRTGDGLGMIVRRGYKQPPSFHEPRLRSAPADHFVTTMTEGFGVMPSYAEEVSLPDRWAIAAYIRALQYSQNARLAEIPADRRQAVESEIRKSLDPASGAQGVTRPDPRLDYDRRPADAHEGHEGHEGDTP